MVKTEADFNSYRSGWVVEFDYSNTTDDGSSSELIFSDNEWAAHKRQANRDRIETEKFKAMSSDLRTNYRKRKAVETGKPENSNVRRSPVKS